MDTGKTTDLRSAGELAAEAARRLGEAILAQSELKVYEECSASVERDAEAQKLLSDFRQAVGSLQALEQWNGAANEDRERLDRAQTQMYTDPKVSAYLRAQEELIGLLRGVNEYISDRLGFNFALFARSSSGCYG